MTHVTGMSDSNRSQPRWNGRQPYANRNRPNKSNVTCYYCHKVGHMKKVSATFNTAAPKFLYALVMSLFWLFSTQVRRVVSFRKVFFRKLPILKEKICSELVVELYDVHNKKLETLEKLGFRFYSARLHFCKSLS